MSYAAVDWAIKLTHDGMEASTKLVLIVLCQHADEMNRCWPSIRKLCKMTSLTPTTVRTHLKKLEHAGLVQRQLRASEQGDNDSSMTIINVKTGTSIINPPPSIINPRVGQLQQEGGLIIEGGVRQLLTPNISKESINESFDALWSSWQPYEMVKGNKQTALKSYQKIIASGVTPDDLQAAAKTYCESCHARRCKTQHVVTWLNQRGFESVEAAPATLQYADPLTDPRRAII